MNESNNIVSIKLLDREYQVKCPPEKLAALLEAATYLDLKMRESCDGEKMLNRDRIFMIAALNISNDLIAQQRQKNRYIDNMNQRIQDLHDKIEQALAQ